MLCLTVAFASLPINDNSALSLECIAFFVVADSISAGLSAFVSVCFAMFYKFALLRSQICKRVILLYSLEIAQCRLTVLLR